MSACLCFPSGFHLQDSICLNPRFRSSCCTLVSNLFWNPHQSNFCINEGAGGKGARGPFAAYVCSFCISEQQALRHHPDKNPGNVEEATAQFKLAPKDAMASVCFFDQFLVMFGLSKDLLRMIHGSDPF